MAKIPKLIFDTSAVNALEKDEDKNAIIEGLRVAYHMGTTETVLSEIAADPAEPRRKAHLDLLKRFLAFGKCVMPFQWIIEAHAKANVENPNDYEWRKLNVRFVEAENEIAREEIIHTVSDETREQNKKTNKEYLGLFRTAKTAFDKIFKEGNQRPSLEEVAKVLVAPGGAHFVIAADLFDRATGKRPSDVEIKDFVERCPPFKALIMALCFSQYDLCIRVRIPGDVNRRSGMM